MLKEGGYIGDWCWVLDCDTETVDSHNALHPPFFAIQIFVLLSLVPCPASATGYL